jgi:hypothetical protein
MRDSMSSSVDAEQGLGSSETILDYVLSHQIVEARPATVVDFGAGGGKNGRIVREALGDDVRITAVEGFERTARMLAVGGPYDEVRPVLIEDWIRTDSGEYDLAIFGDVLEHLTPRQIHETLGACATRFKAMIVVSPLHDIFQESCYGNALEVHRSFITSGFFDRYDVVEKHIVIGREWTIMNVFIRPGSLAQPWYRSGARSVFFAAMRVLQPMGLAKPLVGFLKKYLKKYRWLLRD